jgi:hypothetical protein
VIKKGFFLFLLCSFGIHFLVTVVIPDFLGNDSGIIRIRLLGSRDIEMDISPENRPHRVPGSDQSMEEQASRPPSDDPVLQRKMRELSLGESLKAPTPDVFLPPVESDAPPEERIERIRSSPFYQEIAKVFEELKKPGGNYTGMEFDYDASFDLIRKEKVESDRATEPILTRLKSGTNEGSIEPVGERPLGILGPVGRRELTYVPPRPDVKATIETDFKMKFWVRPNGTVDRIIHLSREGDMKLETVVINYLRQWRFRAIPEDEPQVEEWGMVTITFGLQ